MRPRSHSWKDGPVMTSSKNKADSECHILIGFNISLLLRIYNYKIYEHNIMQPFDFRISFAIGIFLELKLIMNSR
jgi:hypothetical protein